MNHHCTAEYQDVAIGKNTFVSRLGDSHIAAGHNHRTRIALHSVTRRTHTQLAAIYDDAVVGMQAVRHCSRQVNLALTNTDIVVRCQRMFVVAGYVQNTRAGKHQLPFREKCGLLTLLRRSICAPVFQHISPGNHYITGLIALIVDGGTVGTRQRKPVQIYAKFVVTVYLHLTRAFSAQVVLHMLGGRGHYHIAVLAGHTHTVHLAVHTRCSAVPYHAHGTFPCLVLYKITRVITSVCCRVHGARTRVNIRIVRTVYIARHQRQYRHQPQ